MQKKVLLILGVAVLLFFALSGCFGGGHGGSSVSYEPQPGTVDPAQAWAESDWADTDSPTVDSTIDIGLNSSEKVTEISITISFEDSDAAHSETDDGSDPDDIVISLTDGDNTSQPASGSTPCSLTVSMNATEGGYMSGTWELRIQATCNGGKPATLVPRPGILPGPFVYKDQGVAYSMSGDYIFLVEVAD